MSDADQTPIPDMPDMPDMPDEQQQPAPAQSRRAARAGSVASKQGPDDSLEQANRSLAEALKVTFRLIQLAMIVLAVLYVLSGFQSVRADERGIRVVFGRAIATDLSPGFQFSWPYPIGEMIKVSTGTRELRLYRDFWPYVQPGQEDRVTTAQLRRSRTLNPADDGSLVTADGNIVHTRWVVNYSRADSFAYASGINPTDSERLVLAAVKRGIVRAVAEVTIDDLLKQSSSQEASVARRAQRNAQELLDKVGSGIRIDQLSLNDKIPPVFVRDKFAGVQTAATNASRAREEAQREANEHLNRVAGQAAGLLRDLIDDYEGHLATGDKAAAQSTMARINEVMEGRGSEPIAGRVAQMLSVARQDRSRIVSRARSDAVLFAAKLEEFKANPKVMVERDWWGALAAFVDQPNVRSFTVPSGGQLRVLLNSDPEVDREMVQQARRTQAQRAAEERAQQQQIMRRRSETGIRMDN